MGYNSSRRLEGCRHMGRNTLLYRLQYSEFSVKNLPALLFIRLGRLSVGSICLAAFQQEEHDWGVLTEVRICVHLY